MSPRTVPLRAGIVVDSLRSSRCSSPKNSSLAAQASLLILFLGEIVQADIRPVPPLLDHSLEAVKESAVDEGNRRSISSERGLAGR